VTSDIERLRKTFTYLLTYMSVGLICPWTLLPETENAFNCSRHQRSVTVAFRRCV